MSNLRKPDPTRIPAMLSKATPELTMLGSWTTPNRTTVNNSPEKNVWENNKNIGIKYLKKFNMSKSSLKYIYLYKYQYSDDTKTQICQPYDTCHNLEITATSLYLIGK